MPVMAEFDEARELEVLQENPKRAPSKSWERYEQYKSATTVGEFLERGGTPADLAHDVGKGFVRYLDQAGHLSPPKPKKQPKAKSPREPSAKRAPKEARRRRAEVDPWLVWDDDELDDVCDVCGESTLTDAGAPMASVLICDGCEAETHLRCSGLKAVPEADWRCRHCVDPATGDAVRRPARALPQRDDPDARAAQLVARCLRCCAVWKTTTGLGGLGYLQTPLPRSNRTRFP